MTAAPQVELAELAAAVVAAAQRRGATIVLAESATGGLIGHLLTEVPGASAVFLGGWVTYADDRKVEDLGVSAALVREHGAVSQPVVETMAQGARKRAKATHAVATSGIAGPGGATPTKPVGTLWCAVAGPAGVHAHRIIVAPGDRSATKRAFAEAALATLLDALEADDAR